MCRVDVYNTNKKREPGEIPVLEIGEKITVKRTAAYRISNKILRGKVAAKTDQLIIIESREGVRECFSKADFLCKDAVLIN